MASAEVRKQSRGIKSPGPETITRGPVLMADERRSEPDIRVYPFARAIILRFEKKEDEGEGSDGSGVIALNWPENRRKGSCVRRTETRS